MPAAILHLDGQNIIEQHSYWFIRIQYPGNVAGARLRGQIKNSREGELLTEFRFDTGTYDEGTEKTEFLMSLRAFQTSKLPIPEEDELWVYDVLIQLPEQPDPRRLLQGNVNVSPGVTQ